MNKNTIKDILDIFPLAAAWHDSSLDYPLHCIVASEEASNITLDLLKLIYDAYPPAAGIRNTNGKYPLHWAASNSTGDAIQFLCERFPDAAKGKDYKDRYPLDLASANDQVTSAAIRALCAANPEAAKKCKSDGDTILHTVVAVADLRLEDVKAVTLYEMNT